LLEIYHDLQVEHTAWVQRIHAVLFHQGAAQPVRAARCAEFSRASRAHGRGMSAAGQLQVATALDMLTALEAHLNRLRRELVAAAGPLDRGEGAHRGAVWGGAERVGVDMPAGRGGPMWLDTSRCLATRRRRPTSFMS
jgi:hypothetical protein